MRSIFASRALRNNAPNSASLAAEAELGALFLNAREAKILRLTLHELGHPQPPTPIHVDNTTVTGIVNNTIKRQRSRSMEMRYFWLLDGEAQKYFAFHHHPGQENLEIITQSHILQKTHNMPNHFMCMKTFPPKI